MERSAIQTVSQGTAQKSCGGLDSGEGGPLGFVVSHYAHENPGVTQVGGSLYLGNADYPGDTGVLDLPGE